MMETPRSLSEDGDWDLSVFECKACGIDFFTQDHVPLTGLPGNARSARTLFPKLDTVRSREVFHAISTSRH